MDNIEFVAKKIGNSHLVWFKESNLYYQFKEPVWFVFKKLREKTKFNKIAREFSKRYNYSENESINFVDEVYLKINELSQPDNSIENPELQLPNLIEFKYNVYAVHNYSLGNKLIQFTFETSWLENYIHPLIEHLETENKNSIPNHLELFTFNGRVIFRFNGQIMGSWSDDESHLTKGKIFMTLLNVMYEKKDADWLMTVHASALSNGKKTMLFSAPPNSGKSTIAALLYTQGYQIISDDFVAIDRQSFKAYPFPSAMSVKDQSLDFLKPMFPALEHKKLNYINDEKSVRYLPLDNPTSEMIFPVKEFIFVKYDKSVNFKWEKLETLEAIILLLDQTWVAPTFANAEMLFDKVEESSFFKLTYSNTEKALQTLKQLFEND